MNLTNARTHLRLSRNNLLWVHLGLILLLGAVVYSNSFHAPFELDDHYSINFFGTSKIMDLLLRGGYRQVVDISFALNHYVHGMQLAGYHITNLAIHLATATTVYFFVLATIDSQRVAGTIEEPTFVEQFVPFATALLFACHPIQTQAVTYIIQRYTSLAAFFYLLSALAFIKSRCAVEQEQNRRKMWLWASTSLMAALLAMGCKQIAMTLPLMLVLLEYILFRGRLLNRRFFIACAAMIMVIPAIVMYEWQKGTLDDFLFDLRHATSDNIYMSRTTYFLTQTRVVATYLRLLVLPINQNLIYDYPTYSTLFSAPVLASLALHGSLILSAVIMVRISRRSHPDSDRSREICLRLAALGIAWFYIALAVESSFIPIRDVIFEHRVYLPSVGFFLMITALTTLAVRDQRTRIKVAWCLLAVCSLVLGAMTISRNQVWNDSLTLWQDNARKSPNKGIVLSNLAAEYLNRNMPEKSLQFFVRAIEANPNLDFRAKIGVGSSLQALRIYRSRFTTGEEYILPGGPFNSGNLDFGNFSKWEAVINNTIGLAYEHLNEPAKARHMYEASVTMNPAYDLGWYNLAILSAKEGKKEQVMEAIGHLRILNPPMAESLESVVLR